VHQKKIQTHDRNKYQIQTSVSVVSMNANKQNASWTPFCDSCSALATFVVFNRVAVFFYILFICLLFPGLFVQALRR
jgi:hypothetical protein